jgi:hypothetical protein
MDNREYQKLIDDHYKQYRGEWLELQDDKWHWRCVPFATMQAAKRAIDKAMIRKAAPKGEMIMGFKKAI